MLFLRSLKTVFRQLARSRALWLMVAVLQVLVFLPAASGSYDANYMEASEVENLRLYATSEALAQQGNDYGDSAYAAWLAGQQAELADCADRAVVAWDAGDMPAYFSAYADYLELQGAQSGGVGMRDTNARIAQYRALSSCGATAQHASTGDMPASLYLVSADKALLIPLAPYLPFLTESAGSNAGIYVDAYDHLLMIVPLAVVALVAARLHVRGRLATQLPAPPRTRLLASSTAAALAGVCVLALICAPVFLYLLVRNGLGDLAYPVVFGRGSEMVVSSVGAVLARTAALYALIALACSLLAHLVASALDSVVPAAAGLVAAAALSCFPGYYGQFSAFRDIAAALPVSYLNVGYAAGAYSSFPPDRALPGISFANGCASLGATIGVLLLLLAIVAPHGALVRWADAVRIGAAQIREGMGSRAVRRGDGGSAAVPPSRSLQLVRASTSSPAASVGLIPYARALFRMLLSHTAIYACIAVMAGAFLLPAVFSIDPDVSALSTSQYVDGNGSAVGELRELRDLLSSGAYERGSAEYDRLQLQYDLLYGFAYGSDLHESYRSLAAYDRSVLEFASQGDSVLSAPVDSARTEARALMAERLAQLDNPTVYSLGVRMPGSFYLSFTAGVMPFVFWLLPAVVASLLVIGFRTRGSLLQQVPTTFAVELTGGCIVAFAVACAMLLAVVIPGTAVATAHNGIGELGYPVVYVQNGAAIASTVARSLAAGAGMHVLVTLALVVFLAVVSQVTRSFRATCAAAASAVLLAVVTTAVSPALAVSGAGLPEGMASVLGSLLSWLPFTYFDVAAVVGAAGYAFSAAPGATLVQGVVVTVAFIPIALAIGCIVLRVRRAHPVRAPAKVTGL